MHNVIMRKITVGAEYQPLSDVDLIGSVEISTPPTNTATVNFLGDDGSDVPWAAGDNAERAFM
jgi:hypothetical protein